MSAEPEAGQWWFPDNAKPGQSAGGKGVYIVGLSAEGRPVYQSDADGQFDVDTDDFDNWHHEPRCTGWDWVVPEQQKPAEDPDETKQAEQWPKYYTGTVPGTAYVKRLSSRECVVVETDGTETVPMRWADWDERKRTEITEAEAMALIKKSEPQPQKTRVRLWATRDGIVWMSSGACPLRDWQELHHDSEGFYVEGGQS